VVFSTPIFIYGFLPLALAVYYLLPRRARNGWLVAASYFFYGWGNPLYVVLLLFSTLLDFGCGLGIAKSDSRARRLCLLWGSIVGNLGVLAFFKYSGFFARVSHDLVGVPGAETLLLAGGIVLPLGISFYTFQSLSYTIDVYRREIEPTRRFVDFAAYVALFPQLVAGPIVRFSQLATALRERRETRTQFNQGVGFLVIGLSKKLLIANPCGSVADLAFGSAELDVLTAWTGMLAYSFQIYFDFSGYSEMAIGLGLMLGFVLPPNFKAPYRATSLSDFWRRWHITLGSWVRDYLYHPMGGSRRGLGRTTMNLFLVMVLVGLWHGAAWQFLVWGALHGLFLGLERVMRPRFSKWGKTIPAVFQVLFTFVVVSLCWVVFRADSLGEAGDYYAALFGGYELAGPAWWTRSLMISWETGAVLGGAALVTWMGVSASQFVVDSKGWKWFVLTVLFWSCLIAMGAQEGNPFLYYYF
jgi:alginate O-acetyltransferase complex protein AlgI